MSEVSQKRKKDFELTHRNHDIYREDAMVRVVNQAKYDREFNAAFGGIIRKVKRAFNVFIDVMTLFFSAIGLGTAIWFIATVLM